MKNLEGTRIPHLKLRTREGAHWKEIDTDQLFKGRTVVVFALPGAFTPTCSSAHVPRYNELVPQFKRHGVDEVACLSVNDPFVMEAWQKEQHADQVTFLPDGNGELSKALGALVDKSDLGFGPRSWRYSMLVKDGVIEKMFVEDESKPGDPFETSDADTMLRFLSHGEKPPSDVIFFGRPGCIHCERTKQLLDKAGLAYDELPASPRRLRAVSGKSTTPQVFIDGKHIGGADELEVWLGQQR